MWGSGRPPLPFVFSLEISRFRYLAFAFLI